MIVDCWLLTVSRKTEFYQFRLHRHSQIQSTVNNSQQFPMDGATGIALIHLR